MGCTKKVLCSYESEGPSVRAKHKIGQYDLISWFNMSAFSLHAHAMYEHNASDYEFVGPRGPLQDSHLIIDNRLWRYNIDRTTTVMNRRRIVNVSLSP